MTRGLRAVLAGGLLVTVLDIAAAFAVAGARGTGPVRVLQGIASGATGPDAFQGGAATAALGLLFHALIAFTATAVYYVASRDRPWLVRHPWLAGPSYGVVAYLVMNWIVIPLSRIPARSQPWRLVFVMVVIHMVCVGLPIALATTRARRTSQVSG